jgi:putative membrane protein
LKDIVSDPKLSRLVIGLPAIVLILYGIFGQYGWRLILGIAGVFLFIKGFNLEGTVQKAYDELKSWLIGGRISFFTYAVAALIAVIGVVSGYDELAKIGYTSISNAIPIFISGSIDLLAFAAIVALIGKGIDAILEQQEILRYFIYSVFVIAFWLILDATSLFLLGKIRIINLAVSIILGLILPTVAILIKKSVRRT